MPARMINFKHDAIYSMYFSVTSCTTLLCHMGVVVCHTKNIEPDDVVAIDLFPTVTHVLPPYSIHQQLDHHQPQAHSITWWFTHMTVGCFSLLGICTDQKSD